jgi:transposase-like protein
MRKSRFSVEQITYALKQVEMHVPVAEVCRKLGISEQTFYAWKKKYGGRTEKHLSRHVEHVKACCAGGICHSLPVRRESHRALARGGIMQDPGADARRDRHDVEIVM